MYIHEKQKELFEFSICLPASTWHELVHLIQNIDFLLCQASTGNTAVQGPR